MNLKKLGAISLIFLLIGVFSGCQEQEAADIDTIPANIQLDSELVKLVNGSIKYITDGPRVLRTEVEYLFKNIAGKILSIEVTAEFYDKNDMLLYTGGPKYIENMPIDYIETEVFPPNTITYTGIDAGNVDHVKIIVIER